MIELESGLIEASQEVAQLRQNQLSSANFGLSLEKSTWILRTIQQKMLAAQVAEYNEQPRFCPDCGRPRQVKGKQQKCRRVDLITFGWIKLIMKRLNSF